jgi:hypothetical protein
MALGALAGAALGTAAWVGVTELRASPAVVESYVYLGVILCLGALVARWVADHAGRRSVTAARHGGVTLWVLLALVTAVGLPGFSYLFVWPALAGVAGLLWHPRHPAWATARFAIVAAPTLVLMTPAVDYLFLFAQPRPGNPDSQVKVAVLVPLLFGLLAALLLWERWHRPDPHTPPGRAPTTAAP